MANRRRECAELLLETIPLVMRSLRREMRERHGKEVTVPQFRTLMYLLHHGGASLSAVAGKLDSSLPTASKLIDGLVEKGWVERVTSPEDRRRVCLELTEPGRQRLEERRQEAIEHLAGKLGDLSAAEVTGLAESLRVLSSLYLGEHLVPNPDSCKGRG